MKDKWSREISCFQGKYRQAVGWTFRILQEKPIYIPFLFFGCRCGLLSDELFVESK